MIVHITQEGTSFSFTQDEGKLICKGLKNQLPALLRKIDEIQNDKSINDKDPLVHEKKVKAEFIEMFTGFFTEE